MLRAPIEEGAGKLLYHFDGGGLAYEWTLTLEDGIMIGFRAAGWH